MKINKEFILKSILAGFLIAIAGVFYSQVTTSTFMGSFLFSLGLIAVIILEANLYTGKIGYVTKQTIGPVSLMLVINLVTAGLVGFVYRLCVSTNTIMYYKLAKTIPQVLFDAFVCGVCIFLAVELYRRTKNLITVIVPVMAFILSGAEHCIADMFYYCAGPLSWKGLLFLLLVIIGNSAGSLCVRFLISYLALQPKKLLE